MKDLKNLLAKLCPNGVKYKRLGNLGKFYGGITSKSKDEFTNGNAVFITYRNVYSNPALNVFPEDRVKISENEKQNTLEYGDVIFTGSSETPHECGLSSVVTTRTNEKLYLNSFCFAFRFDDLSSIEPIFYKHLFRSKKLRNEIVRTANGVIRFNVSRDKMANIVIPVPPLEIQKEIANILDKFSASEDGLTPLLKKELAKREKQYKYYRNKLLNFVNSKNVNWYPLEEVFIIRNGYTPSKRKPEYWENGRLPWFRMDDIRLNGHILSDSLQHITEKAIGTKKLFPAGSIILSTTATIGEHALLIADSLANQRFTFFTKSKSLKEELDEKYSYYYFYKIGEWCKRNTNVGSFPSVDMKKLRKLRFPIPPVEIQKEIVNILDKFATLKDRLISLLEKELAIRQKQYEYYREKLLTFNV